MISLSSRVVDNVLVCFFVICFSLFPFPDGLEKDSLGSRGSEGEEEEEEEEEGLNRDRVRSRRGDMELDDDDLGVDGAVEGLPLDEAIEGENESLLGLLKEGRFESGGKVHVSVGMGEWGE